MTTTRSTIALLAVTAAAAAGCGDDDSGTDAADKKPATSAQAAPPTVPAELLGTYAVSLRKSDLPPNPAPELTHGPQDWELTIANSGGVDNGPSFTISNVEGGPIESTSFVAADGMLELPKDECYAGGSVKFYASRYRYEVSGDTLRFSTVENKCKDLVTKTILTSHPWRKKG